MEYPLYQRRAACRRSSSRCAYGVGGRTANLKRPDDRSGRPLPSDPCNFTTIRYKPGSKSVGRCTCHSTRSFGSSRISRSNGIEHVPPGHVLNGDDTRSGTSTSTSSRYRPLNEGLSAPSFSGVSGGDLRASTVKKRIGSVDASTSVDSVLPMLCTATL